MSETIIVAVIAAIPTTLASIAAFLQSRKNTAKLAAIHVEINGRLTQLLELTGKASHAQGMKDELDRDK